MVRAPEPSTCPTSSSQMLQPEHQSPVHVPPLPLFGVTPTGATEQVATHAASMAITEAAADCHRPSVAVGGRGRHRHAALEHDFELSASTDAAVALLMSVANYTAAAVERLPTLAASAVRAFWALVPLLMMTGLSGGAGGAWLQAGAAARRRPPSSPVRRHRHPALFHKQELIAGSAPGRTPSRRAAASWAASAGSARRLGGLAGCRLPSLPPDPDHSLCPKPTRALPRCRWSLRRLSISLRPQDAVYRCGEPDPDRP